MTSPPPTPQRPATVKIWLGAGLTIVECVTGGHFFEQLKVVKQAQATPYLDIVKNSYRLGGLFDVFYRGYFPWGVVQSVSKGLPVLFVPGEAQRLGKGIVPDNMLMAFGGMCGGVAQGFTVTPTQRLKTIVMTAEGQSPGQLILSTLRRDGYLSVFRGVHLMAARRSIDWTIRFYGLAKMMRWLEELQGEQKMWHKLASGFFGGAISLVTQPIDTSIARMQKDGGPKTMRGVAQEVLAQNGIGGFFKGGIARIFHSGYHTAVVAGGGMLVYDWLEQRKAQRPGIEAAGKASPP